MLTLENITDLELLRLASSLEGELILRTADKLAKIPDEIYDFVYDNRGFFEEELSINDISSGSTCFDLNTADKIIYKASITEGDTEFKWEIIDNTLFVYLDGVIVLEVETSYNLTFKNLED